MLYNINYETLKELYDNMKLKKKIENRVFKTYDEEGNLHEITPKQIEKVLKLNDHVVNAVVVNKKDDIKMNVPFAFVVLKMGTNITELLMDLMDLCRIKLEYYEIPVDIKLVDKFPLQKNGKIDYKDLENIANEEYYNYHDEKTLIK